MLAVIETGGKQYIVRDGEALKIEKIEGAEGDKVTFDKVLLLSDAEGNDVQIGTPYLDGVTISAQVETQGRSKKIRVIKYKRKIRYKRTKGHRQHFTKVKVEKVK